MPENNPTLADAIPNVLAERYASAEMKSIWSPRGRILLERELWIAVLKAQRDLGLTVSTDAIDAYERVKERVDLDEIRERERVSRHDVKARIEAFCALAGHEELHRGMTSRDLTENVEQLQAYRALSLLRRRACAIVDRFGALADRYRETMISARTHNVPAQPTTLGKRLAMFGEEFLRAARGLEAFVADYPVRGLKGAVGTQVDLLTLFEGDAERVAELEERILGHLGLPSRWHAVGQVYPRSLDLETVQHLLGLASAPASFALTLRLMAGHELAGEGFAEGQTGSSAMPHKTNARSCERIGGFQSLLRGYAAMAASLAGNQWNEGDVSCSVVRRVMLPDSFFACDGLFETVLTVLDQMQVFPGMVARENDRYLPFLLSTTVLMEAVKHGAGRESAHTAIKEHALVVAEALRAGESASNDLFSRLAQDDRIGLSARELEAIRKRAETLTGGATAQVDAFVRQAREWSARDPEAAAYRPAAIL